MICVMWRETASKLLNDPGCLPGWDQRVLALPRLWWGNASCLPDSRIRRKNNPSPTKHFCPACNLSPRHLQLINTARMICRSCLRAAARRQLPRPSPSQTPRFLSSSSSLRNTSPVAASTSPPPIPQTAPPNTTAHPPPEPNSNATAQSLGSILLKKTGEKEAVKPHLVKSSIPAGTPLKGLNFLKNQSDPVAMADDEYPDWLWTVLEKQEEKGEAAAAGDLFCMSSFSYALRDILRRLITPYLNPFPLFPL